MMMKRMPQTLAPYLVPLFLLIPGFSGAMGAALDANQECFTDSATDYSVAGPWESETRVVDGFEVWVPLPREGCDRFPLVGFGLGTGMPGWLYQGYYANFASWGMMVVVDPSNIINLGGGSLTNAMRAVLADPDLGPKVLNTGVVGHSQGGAAAVNIALGDQLEPAAIVGIMPSLFQGLGSIDVPGLYIGADADQFSVATDPGLAYSKTTGPAFIASMEGVTHTLGAISRQSNALTTAWLRCHLVADGDACGLFEDSLGESCLFHGDYSVCDGKNL